MLIEQLTERLTSPEDQHESELESFKKLPDRYPEGKMAIWIHPTNGNEYLVMRRGKQWYDVGSALAEVT